MASIDRVMALAEELKKKKKDPNYEVSQSTINTLDLANSLQSGNKNALKTYMSNYDSGFDAPLKSTNDRSWFKKSKAFEDGYDLFDVSKSLLATGTELKNNAVAGILGMGEKAVDYGALAVGKVGKALGNQEIQDKMATFVKKDLYDENAIAKKTGIFPADSLTKLLLTGKSVEDYSFAGDRTDSLAQSGGQLLATFGLQAVGVPWWLTTGLVSAGAEAENALNSGATYNEALFSGAWSAGAEILTEKLSGGISFGGKTVDDVLLKPLTDKIANKTIQTLTKFGIDVVGEGTEEVLTEIISNVGKKLSYEDEKTWGEMLTSEEAMDSYLEAFIGGAVLGGGMNIGRTANSIKTGRDYDTGLTDNEQAVVNVEVARRTNGQTLTNKQKAKIEAEVKEDLQRGFISTDTIESTLGGDTYNTLKSVRDNKTNLETQIKELENKPNAEITVKEMEQLNDYREQLEKIDTTELESHLQSEMGAKIQSDGYLQRSYQEKAKRSQEFTYEVAETDSEFRKGVLESTKGKLNDTTRSHETVEAVAKLSEDRQMQYKFTNNAELKELGLVPEGKTANGLYVVEKDGKREILVNTDSKKYIEAVLVHETAHDFQTTSPETYTKLVDITREFAEAQGDYARVYSEVAGMYKNVKDAKIDEEVTSRLLEDYLGNKEFINSLTTKEPSIVKKIIDEIKYLVKKFTAGSPEARKLVELQHDLEKTYREAYRQTKVTNAKEGTKYSTSERTIQGLESYSIDEIKQLSKDYIEQKLEENGFYDIEIKEIAIHGSRGRGTAKADSDLDVVVEYKGDIREDDLFSILNEEPMFIDDIQVDINPITELMNDYMARSDAYDKEVLSNTKYSLSEETYNTLENERQIIHVGNVLGILNSETFSGSVAMQQAGIRPSYYKNYKEGIVFKPAVLDYLNKDKLYKGDGGRAKLKDGTRTPENPNKYSNIEDFINEDTSKRQITKYNEGIIEKDNQIPINSDTVDYILIDSSTSQELIDKAKEMGIEVRYSTQKVQYSLSEEGKLVDNKGNDITLEASDTGTHGSLMAIHNLNESKMKGILELGGFPVPSIAVTNPNLVNHKDFGNISVLFDKNTIDPANRYNEVYDRDVWSPTFPQIDYEIDKNNSDVIAENIGVEEWRLDDYADESNSPQDLAYKLSRKEEVVDKYVQDNNLTYETKYKETKLRREFNDKDSVKDFIKSNDIVLVDLMENNELRQKYYELTGLDGELKRVIDDSFELWKVDRSELPRYLRPINDDIRTIKEGTTKVIDEYSTKQEKRNVALENGLEEYLTKQVQPMFGEKGIRNNKEYLTPSGNRRSFWQLHDEYNIDNIVKNLTSQDTKGSQKFFGTGFGHIQSQMANQFNSIEDIKRAENRLVDMSVTNEELVEIKTNLQNDLNVLADKSGSDWGGLDLASELVADFAKGKHDIASFRKLLKNYYQTFNGVTDTDIQNIIDDLQALREIPTDYFEAKPQRAVGLDEAQAIVIPNNVDAEFKQQLQEAGLKYYEYDPNIEGDRQRVINQFDDLKFSLSNENDIAPTSTRTQTATQDIRLQVEEAIAPLQEEIVALREQINLTSEPIQPIERVDEFAPASQEVVEQQGSEAFNTIEDTDMPSEIEDTTPEAEELTPTESLFETRDYAEVGDRKIKAYQYENPEVRPFFQQAAREMMSDLDASIKGERYIIGDNSQVGNGDYYYSGNTRHTTEDIAELLDGIDGKYKYTYAEIRKGLQAIIEDNGLENNAASKRIEFYLDKRLREGYTDIDGYTYPADEGYLDVLRVKGISDYYSSLPIGEAPVEDASNTEVVEDIAPVRNSTGYTTIGGQQHLNLNNLGETLQDNNVDWDSVENTGLENARQLTIDGTEEDLVKKTKKELRKALLGTEAQKEFITEALDNAKNRSMAFMNNTDTIRNTELVFGRDAGRIINEVIFQKEIDNEADSIKWQNKERDEVKALGIKARSKESAAVQKYGEKQYADDSGNVIPYGDTELAIEFPDVATQNKIKNAAQVIRNKYDAYIDLANGVLTKLGFDPIKKRNDYMRHFQELNDVFSRWGLPFNAQNMQEHVLPTDINGLTEFWSPQKNYFANMQARKGVKTTYDAITGVDGYIGGIANLIYHTEDIQRGRAFEELIRETYGEDKGWDNLENLPDEIKQLRAEKIQDNHLSNYAAWVHEWTNNVAGKKNKIDRSVESVFGRKAFSFLDQIRKQVGSNMIGFNLSSSMTNLIAPVQAMAKTNKLAVVKGTADTIKNIFIKDNFMDNNRFLTSRMGTDMISKNAWQKIQDAGYVFMKGMDWFSSNQIVRSKYYELRSKGMSEAQAHAEAGQFAARILGDRTKGANAQLYNSKLIGVVTQFQLEVNNQLYSMFYDTYHESKEAARNNAAKTAAGMTFTLGQLFAFTHLFGKTFESIAGYNPTFDVIGMLMTALGWGDDDEEKTTSERLKAAADQLVDALPYVNILTGGGRVPIASGIPNVVGVMTGGKDQYGNELTWEDELKKLLYLIPPTGGNQVKKTTQGLGMFDEDLPVSGSYTDSGNLRFPVEDTPLNRLQAGLFGQWASENARNYFDNERQPLKEKQIQEYADLDLPIKEYWEYREGLKEQNTTQEKFDYINSLDVSSDQKNIMINNAIDRKDAVDMSNYDDFGGYEEFDYATKNPDKYRVIEQIDTYNNYMSYKDDIASIKEQFSTDNGYDTKQRKAAVQQYIQSLNLDIPQKIMLEKMAGGYSIKSYESYMYSYIESLPLTAEEKQAIHKQLFD